MKKRVISLFFVIALLCIMLAVGATSALAASETDIAYPVEGGNIYFDKATGKITDCDDTVTAAIIPAEIDGVAVTAIGDYAFKKCKSLTDVKIADSVTTIGDDAFSYCTGLTSVTIPDSVTTIGLYAFYNCHALASVTIPDSVITIGNSAFYNCDGLTSVTIPDSVTSLGQHTFHGCDALTSVEIGDSVTSIGLSTFYECHVLTSVTIGNSVTSIGNYAFYDCYALTNVTIPDSVTTIGNCAFYNCDGLTSIEIPDGVSTIGEEAFWDCDDLTSVTIGDSVTTIGEKAFYDCDGLTSVTIPGSVKEIMPYAFAGCNNLTTVTIAEGVKYIRTRAFSSCGSLTSITIPSSMKSIDTGAFDVYDANIYYNGTLENLHLIVGSELSKFSAATLYCTDGVYGPAMYEYMGMCFDKRTGTIFSYDGSSAVVHIPAEIDGVAVTTIGKRAFAELTELAHVTLDHGITTIEEGAFEYCSNLYEVHIPTSVKTIKEDAFYAAPEFTEKDDQYDQLMKIEMFFSKFHVYYAGSEAQWAKIEIAHGNAYLAFAEDYEHIHFENRDSEGDTEDDGTEDDGTEGGGTEGGGTEGGGTEGGGTVDNAVLNDNLSFTMDITVGAEMRVNYSFLASDVKDYTDFWFEISKAVAHSDPITTVYGNTSDREPMSPVVHPTTNEALLYQIIYTGINAKEMGDRFTATLYVMDADGNVYKSRSTTASIKDFLIEKLNDEDSSAEMKTLAVDMLKYGAAAQRHFDYIGEDSFVTDSLTEEQLSYGTQSYPFAGNYHYIYGEGANVTTSITLGSKVELTLSCIVDGLADPDSVKCVITDNAGEVLAELAAVNSAGTMYSVTYDNVGAKEMRKIIIATFYDAEGNAISKTVHWSVESYVAQEGTGDGMFLILNAMLTYGDSVAAYMRANGQ